MSLLPPDSGLAAAVIPLQSEMERMQTMMSQMSQKRVEELTQLQNQHQAEMMGVKQMAMGRMRELQTQVGPQENSRCLGCDACSCVECVNVWRGTAFPLNRQARIPPGPRPAWNGTDG